MLVSLPWESSASRDLHPPVLLSAWPPLLPWFCQTWDAWQDPWPPWTTQVFSVPIVRKTQYHTQCPRRGFHPIPKLWEANTPAYTHRYNGPNLVLKYDKAQGRLVNVAEDERGSPYYALRDRQGNAIGVTACDIDGDGREEIYFLNTNNAFSGEPCRPPSPRHGGSPRHGCPRPSACERCVRAGVNFSVEWLH